MTTPGHGGAPDADDVEGTHTNRTNGGHESTALVSKDSASSTPTTEVEGVVERAERLAADGLVVIPVHSVGPDGQTCSCPRGAKCEHPGKHPVGTDWQAHTLETGLAAVRGLAAKRRRLNLGILLEPSGIVVIDNDPRNKGNETIAALKAEGRKLKRTKAVRTGSGGWHTYYRARPGVAWKSTLGKGVDIKHNGFVVAEGSVSHAGPYSVLADEEIVELPDWVVEVGSKPATTSPAPAAKAAIDPDDPDGPRQQRYLGSAWEGELGRLRAMREAAVEDFDRDSRAYKGDDWDNTVLAVTCKAIEFGNHPAMPHTAEDLLDVVRKEAPRDAGFTDTDVERIIRSARDRVGDKARDVPAMPVDPFPSKADAQLSKTSTTSVASGASPAPVDGSEAKVRKDSAATRLTNIARERYTFSHTPEGHPFALPRTGPRIVAMLRGSGSLRSELSSTYLDSYGSPPPQQALTDAITAIEGLALRGDARELHLRVGEHEGALWIDIGDETGEVIRVAADGWSIEPESPILHRRTALTAPMTRPSPGGNIAQLWELLNVAPEDRALLAGYLVAAWFPDMPHPILSVTGEQGAGKSSACRALVSLVDPSTVPLRKTPRDLDSWTVAAFGSHVVAVDNLSDLPIWLSDALCRASTGDGDVKRKLYMDSDLHVIQFRRVVMVNGIDLGAIRDDLADRLVTVDLHRIEEEQRRAEVDLSGAQQDATPQIMGALLDLNVQVLQELPRVNLDRMPRMADFARVLAAVDAVTGEQSLERYVEQASDLAEDAMASTPVLIALETAARQGAFHLGWEGSAAELLERLELALPPYSPKPKKWPEDARKLGVELKRRAPSMRRTGWTVEATDKKTNRGRVWAIQSPVDNSPGQSDEKGDEIGARDLVTTSSPLSSPPVAQSWRGSDEKGDEVTTNRAPLSVLLEKKKEERSPDATAAPREEEGRDSRHLVTSSPGPVDNSCEPCPTCGGQLSSLRAAAGLDCVACYRRGVA